MSRQFIKYPSDYIRASSDPRITQLQSLTIGTSDGYPAVLFKFNKRRYFREECLSYSGMRVFFENSDISVPMDFDKLAKLIIEGTLGIEGLSYGGSGYPFEFNADDLDSPPDPQCHVEFYNWLEANKSNVRDAINKYAQNIDNYEFFEY